MQKNNDFQDLEELNEDQLADEDGDVAEAQLPPDRRRIFTDKLDPKVRDLHQDWKSGDLILDPTFQRRKV